MAFETWQFSTDDWMTTYGDSPCRSGSSSHPTNVAYPNWPNDAPTNILNAQNKKTLFIYREVEIRTYLQANWQFMVRATTSGGTVEFRLELKTDQCNDPPTGKFTVNRKVTVPATLGGLLTDQFGIPVTMQVGEFTTGVDWRVIFSIRNRTGSNLTLHANGAEMGTHDSHIITAWEIPGGEQIGVLDEDAEVLEGLDRSVLLGIGFSENADTSESLNSQRSLGSSLSEDADVTESLNSQVTSTEKKGVLDEDADVTESLIAGVTFGTPFNDSVNVSESLDSFLIDTTKPAVLNENVNVSESLDFQTLSTIQTGVLDENVDTLESLDPSLGVGSALDEDADVTESLDSFKTSVEKTGTLDEDADVSESLDSSFLLIGRSLTEDTNVTESLNFQTISSIKKGTLDEDADVTESLSASLGVSFGLNEDADVAESLNSDINPNRVEDGIDENVDVTEFLYKALGFGHSLNESADVSESLSSKTFAFGTYRTVGGTYIHRTGAVTIVLKATFAAGPGSTASVRLIEVSPVDGTTFQGEVAGSVITTTSTALLPRVSSLLTLTVGKFYRVQVASSDTTSTYSDIVLELR